MGKKFVKDSPIRKSLVGGLISSPPSPQPAESRKDVNAAIQKDGSKVKLTVIIPEEVDLLLEDIARKRRKETGKKPSKKALVIEAIRLLAEKERLS